MGRYRDLFRRARGTGKPVEMLYNPCMSVEHSKTVDAVNPFDLMPEAADFLTWLKDVRGAQLPGGRAQYLSNKEVFVDTYKLWQISKKVEAFSRGLGADLGADELTILHQINGPLILHALNQGMVAGVVEDLQKKRLARIIESGEYLPREDTQNIDWEKWLLERDLRKIFEPKDLGKILIIDNPNFTQELDVDMNTLVGGFHNTVGYREKFGNKIYPSLRLIVGHAGFSNMKDFGNLEEVTEGASFDNQISPKPERITNFNIKRIGGKDLTTGDIERIVSQEIREFGRDKNIEVR